MLLRHLFVAATLGLALVTPATSFADEAQPGRLCILREHHVVSVTPYNVQERDMKGTQRTRLGGAEVYVQAEPGLTAEWLRLQLDRYLSQMRGATTMPDCAFAAEDVRVEVDSAGAGFSVKLIARDKAKAEEVLRRARLLVG